MKRIIALLLICLLSLACWAVAEEDEGGSGVIVFPESEASGGTYEALPESEPSAPTEVERTILGSDDRVRVNDPRQYPFSAIARFDVTAECGCNWECTGFMVTRDTMMTAAHCLVCDDHNKWATNITFYFGYRSRHDYLYKYNTYWTAYVGTMFPNGYTSVNDWGYVHFNENVGDTTGWFGMRYPSDSELESGWYTVAGYRNGELKYDTGSVRVMDADRMWVDADVLPGNSGSPVFDSENYAVGIWTTYYDNANSGFRLSGKTRNKLVAEGLL